jgi:hypothetical protein
VTRYWLEDALRATGLQSCSRFPRDLMSDVVIHLPLSVEGLPSLSARAVRNWLRQRGVQHSVSNADRALHGCLVARAGHGVVFLDSGDEEAEQRFTLAHEIAHFILDHLLPRLRALKVFGDGILPVLDGIRAATREEMLSAVLERVNLDVQVHLMSRGPGGAVCAWGVEESEQRADSLALELLAPARRARARLQLLLGENEDVSGQEERAAEDLAEQFGLPRDVASSYVRLLFRSRRPRLSLSKEIFGSK